MSLFNIDNILEMSINDKSKDETTFSNFTYKNTNFLEACITVANDLRREYQHCNINLHRNAINNNKVKYSDFYNESANVLKTCASKIKNLGNKVLDQYTHYYKQYNLAELSLIDKNVTVNSIPATLESIHNYSLMSLGEDFKISLPYEGYNTKSLRESMDICKKDIHDNLNNLRASYGNQSFDSMYMNQASSVNSDNFIEYLDRTYFGHAKEEIFSAAPETIVDFAKRLNRNDLTDTSVAQFNTVFEDLQISSDAILNLVDNEVNSEAIPYLSSTEEEVKGLKNAYTNLTISQFIESMCTAIIAAGYKAEALFETLMTYRDICDKAENRIQYLKENGKIDSIDILLAEAALEEE